MAALAAAALLASATLAGCTGGSSDKTPSVAAATPTSGATETSSAPEESPTFAEVKFELEDIPVPPEPHHSPQMSSIDSDGAKAFVEYVFEELSWMYATRDRSIFASFSSAECNYCLQRLEQVDEFNVHTIGIEFWFDGWETHPYPGIENAWIVGVDYRMLEREQWDLDTMTVTQLPGDSEPSSLYFAVEHDAEGWLLLEAIANRPVDQIGEKP